MKKESIEQLKTGIIIFLSLVVIVGLVYVISDKVSNHEYNKTTSQPGQVENENPLLEPGEEISDDEKAPLASMDVQGLKKAISNKQHKFVFLGSEYCGWCNYQKPILQYLVYKYDVEINYLNVGEMTEDEYNTLASLHEDLASFGTPTFLVVDGGKITVVDSGARGTKAMETLLKDNGFIK